MKRIILILVTIGLFSTLNADRDVALNKKVKAVDDSSALQAKSEIGSDNVVVGIGTLKPNSSNKTVDNPFEDVFEAFEEADKEIAESKARADKSKARADKSKEDLHKTTMAIAAG